MFTQKQGDKITMLPLRMDTIDPRQVVVALLAPRWLGGRMRAFPHEWQDDESHCSRIAREG
jgi:hypothetical protein